MEEEELLEIDGRFSYSRRQYIEAKAYNVTSIEVVSWGGGGS